MKQTTVTLSAKMILLVTAFSLQACAPARTVVPESQVAQAFESSGTLTIKPYTRTIFSTNDF